MESVHLIIDKNRVQNIMRFCIIMLKFILADKEFCINYVCIIIEIIPNLDRSL